MSLLCADSPAIRAGLIDNHIIKVPSIFFQYFDGSTAILEDDDIYKFIDAITQSMMALPSSESIQRVASTGLTDRQNVDELMIPPPPPLTPHPEVHLDPTPVKRDSVMNTALAMQKAREESEPKVPTPGPKRTELFPNKNGD